MVVKREQVLKVRYSDEELTYLKNFVRMPLAKYVRETSLDKVVTRHTALPVVDKALMRQLTYVGNNLNQAVRLANQQWAYLGVVDCVALAGELAMIRYQLDVILSSHALVAENTVENEAGGLNTTSSMDKNVFELSDDWLDRVEAEIKPKRWFGLMVPILPMRNSRHVG